MGNPPPNYVDEHWECPLCGRILSVTTEPDSGQGKIRSFLCLGDDDWDDDCEYEFED